MNVSPITTNQTNFNGYVDNTFKLFVREAVNQEIRAMLHQTNNSPNVVKLGKFDFTRIQNRGKAIIEKLETQLMKNLHPETSISVRNIGDAYEAYISNSNLGRDILLPINNKPRIPSLEKARITKHNDILVFSNPLEMYSTNDKGSLLDCFERFVNQLIGLEPQKVDKTLLELFAQQTFEHIQKSEIMIFKKLRTQRAGKTADKFAKEIGEPQIYGESFKQSLKNRKIANENNTLARDFIEDIKL